jgi:hypothetical protein
MAVCAGTQPVDGVVAFRLNAPLWLAQPILLGISGPAITIVDTARKFIFDV